MSSTPILTLDPKLPGEALTYSVDFADELDGATISARSVTATGGTAGAAAGAGTLVSSLISGGTAGGRVVALFEATTSDGQTIQCYAIIPIARPPA